MFSKKEAPKRFGARGSGIRRVGLGLGWGR